jgi:uncharacterized membrane protein
MNYAHIHIVLNHFPTIGTVIGLGLLIGGLVKKSEDLERASLLVIVIMALLGIPTYLTGSAAQGMILGDENISTVAIEVHQNAAMMAFALLALTGALAWLGLWQCRRFSRTPRPTVMAALVMTLLTVGAMVRTGTLGGDINHPEIRPEGVEIAATEDLSWRLAGQSFINEHAWSWPAAETLHFIGLSLLFGVAIIVNLRIMGKLKSVPFSAVHRLLPIGVIGFMLCLGTGMLFYVGNAERYVLVPEFGAKIALIVLAGLNLLYFTLFDQPWSIGGDENAPVFSKVMALSTLVFLVGALYFGRMIPFLEF